MLWRFSEEDKGRHKFEKRLRRPDCFSERILQNLVWWEKSWYDRIFSRKQLPGASVVCYYDELTKLAKHAYPGEEAMPDSQFLERFLRGMNVYMKSKVLGKDPRTPQAALEAACSAEGNKMYLEED